MEEQEIEEIYYLKHRYKDRILIPYIGISDNIQFLCSKYEERQVMTADRIRCVATKVEEVHICDEYCERLCKELYDMDVMSWLKLWYKTNKNMSCMRVLHVQLNKN